MEVTPQDGPAADRSKRALLVSPSSKAAGAERALAGLAKYLPSHGWHPTAVLLEHGPLEGWLDSAGCTTVVLASHRTREVHRSIGTVALVARLLRSTEADVVLSNMDKGHLYGGSAALLARCPAVLWQQGIPTGSKRIPSGAIGKLAAAVPKVSVMASCQAAVVAQRALTRVPVHKVHLGINVDEVAAASGRGLKIRASLGWLGETVIGIVGRLQPWKGQEVFLKAADLLAAKRPSLRFCVVGGAILGSEGPYEADLRAYVQKNRVLRDRVYFAGHQDDAYAWMDALDIVVHASFGEPFGLVLVEAMALAKPLVATNVAGPTEIVVEGESGLLVPPGDANALAAALGRVLDEPGLAGHLSVEARARAQLFTEEKMTAHAAAVLDAALPDR